MKRWNQWSSSVSCSEYLHFNVVIYIPVFDIPSEFNDLFPWGGGPFCYHCTRYVTAAHYQRWCKPGRGSLLSFHVRTYRVAVRALCPLCEKICFLNQIQSRLKNGGRKHIILWCKQGHFDPLLGLWAAGTDWRFFHHLGPWQMHIALRLCPNCRTNKPSQSGPGLFHLEGFQPPSWRLFQGSLGLL